MFDEQLRHVVCALLFLYAHKNTLRMKGMQKLRNAAIQCKLKKKKVTWQTFKLLHLGLTLTTVNCKNRMQMDTSRRHLALKLPNGLD